MLIIIIEIEDWSMKIIIPFEVSWVLLAVVHQSPQPLEIVN